MNGGFKEYKTDSDKGTILSKWFESAAQKTGPPPAKSREFCDK
jgi:hypothetical protein